MHPILLWTVLLPLQTPPVPAAEPASQAVSEATRHAIRPKERLDFLSDENFRGLSTWLKDTKHDDPRKVFRRTDEGWLHITGDGFGYIRTNADYEDYLLTVEYKWGKRTDGSKFCRNAGILFNAVGPDGGAVGVWMSCVECQLAQGCVGDLIVIRGKDESGKTIPVRLTSEITIGPDKRPRFRFGGELQTFVGDRQLWWTRHDPDFQELLDTRGKHDVESPLGEWTRVEIWNKSGDIRIAVNGSVVNSGSDLVPPAGKILLQSEGFELFVRRFELLPHSPTPIIRPLK